MRSVALHDLVSHHLTCIYALIGPTPGAAVVSLSRHRCHDVCKDRQRHGPSTTGKYLGDDGLSGLLRQPYS